MAIVIKILLLALLKNNEDVKKTAKKRVIIKISIAPLFSGSAKKMISVRISHNINANINFGAGKYLFLRFLFLSLRISFRWDDRISIWILYL